MINPKIPKAFTISVWFYSLLLWFYVTLRVVFDRVSLTNRFIDYIPFFTFLNTGILSFVISFVSLLVYLMVWGK
jgi:hypothetical protein